ERGRGRRSRPSSRGGGRRAVRFRRSDRHERAHLRDRRRARGALRGDADARVPPPCRGARRRDHSHARAALPDPDRAATSALRRRRGGGPRGAVRDDRALGRYAEAVPLDARLHDGSRVHGRRRDRSRGAVHVRLRRRRVEVPPRAGGRRDPAPVSLQRYRLREGRGRPAGHADPMGSRDASPSAGRHLARAHGPLLSQRGLAPAASRHARRAAEPEGAARGRHLRRGHRYAARRGGGARGMTFEHARKVADAVLYEGYVLYPYRASARKNRLRWQFGVLAPRAWSEAGGGEAWWMQTACLVEPRGDTHLTARVRFLHVRTRRVEEASGEEFRPVESLDVGGRLWTSWEEGVEREVNFDQPLGGDGEAERVVRFMFPSDRREEPIHGVGSSRAGRVV